MSEEVGSLGFSADYLRGANHLWPLLTLYFFHDEFLLRQRRQQNLRLSEGGRNFPEDRRWHKSCLFGFDLYTLLALNARQSLSALRDIASVWTFRGHQRFYRRIGCRNSCHRCVCAGSPIAQHQCLHSAVEAARIVILRQDWMPRRHTNLLAALSALDFFRADHRHFKFWRAGLRRRHELGHTLFEAALLK